MLQANCSPSFIEINCKMTAVTNASLVPVDSKKSRIHTVPVNSQVPIFFHCKNATKTLKKQNLTTSYDAIANSKLDIIMSYDCINESYE